MQFTIHANRELLTYSYSSFLIKGVLAFQVSNDNPKRRILRMSSLKYLVNQIYLGKSGCQQESSVQISNLPAVYKFKVEN